MLVGCELTFSARFHDLEVVGDVIPTLTVTMLYNGITLFFDTGTAGGCGVDRTQGPHGRLEATTSVLS